MPGDLGSGQCHPESRARLSHRAGPGTLAHSTHPLHIPQQCQGWARSWHSPTDARLLHSPGLAWPQPPPSPTGDEPDSPGDTAAAPRRVRMWGSAKRSGHGAVGTRMCFPGVTHLTRGTPVGWASKGGFGEGGDELLNPQAGDQCITLTRVKNNRLVSRNEPVCNYSLACLLQSVPVLAPRQAPANNPCLSSPLCHCLSYFGGGGGGGGGLLCVFESMGLFSPTSSKSKAAAQCPSWGSPHPPSHSLRKPPVPAP